MQDTLACVSCMCVCLARQGIAMVICRFTIVLGSSAEVITPAIMCSCYVSNCMLYVCMCLR